jgi:hypothetical protein
MLYGNLSVLNDGYYHVGRGNLIQSTDLILIMTSGVSIHFSIWLSLINEKTLSSGSSRINIPTFKLVVEGISHLYSMQVSM